MAVNKIKKFAVDAVGENTYTDAEIAALAFLNTGIPFGGVAESDIINAMLRQTTVIVHALAEVILAHQTTVADVTSVDTNLVARLEQAISKLATSVVTGKTADNAGVAVALSTSEEKLITERKIAKAIYNVLDQTNGGFALDARQGKTLSDAIVALQNAGYLDSTGVESLIKVKLNTTGGDTAITTVTVWKGTQAQYDALVDKAGKFCIVVG